MSRKKIKTDSILFCGESSNDVTGSQYFIQFDGNKYLLECGLHQSSSNSYLDSYRINSEKFKFKPNEIKYVFVQHPHIDHCGLLPRLVKEGFTGRIIATKKTAAIMRELLLNCCYILEEEANILSKRYSRNYLPIYEIEDVYKTFELIDTYDEYNKIVQLDESISFQWFHNSHCLGATQIQLIMRSQNKVRRILYTSDIGAIKTKNHYVDNTEIPSEFNDVVIMESTYGSNKKSNNKDRQFDINHLKSAIDTVIARHGTVIFPCFSFSRTQEILTTLYEIYSSDKKFEIPIIIDSQLSCDICKLYSRLLENSHIALWNDVSNWDNVHFVSDKEDSKFWIACNEPKIVISSSGFCTNGRIINYLKKYLSDENSMIIFTGYTGDNQSYLSYRIKNYRNHKYISINKEKIFNKADCITLTSFSSHANQNDLIKYGCSLNTNKLILVHGSDDSKKTLSNELRSAISSNNKSYKVLCSAKGMIVHL